MNTYHTAWTEGCGQITCMVDHTQKYIGTWYRDNLVLGTMLSVNEVSEHTI